jgi:hypothetical protein
VYWQWTGQGEPAAPKPNHEDLDQATEMGCEQGQYEKKLEIYHSQESVQEKLDLIGDKWKHTVKREWILTTKNQKFPS